MWGRITDVSSYFGQRDQRHQSPEPFRVGGARRDIDDVALAACSRLVSETCRMHFNCVVSFGEWLLALDLGNRFRRRKSISRRAGRHCACRPKARQSVREPSA